MTPHVWHGADCDFTAALPQNPALSRASSLLPHRHTRSSTSTRLTKLHWYVSLLAFHVDCPLICVPEPREGRHRCIHRTLVRSLQASQAHLRGSRQGLQERAQRALSFDLFHVDHSSQYTCSVLSRTSTRMRRTTARLRPSTKLAASPRLSSSPRARRVRVLIRHAQTSCSQSPRTR